MRDKEMKKSNGKSERRSGKRVQSRIKKRRIGEG